MLEETVETCPAAEVTGSSEEYQSFFAIPAAIDFT